MENIGDYILQKKIHETRNSITYRGHKKNESQSFIIKFLKTLHARPSDIARFRQEYDLIKNLDIKGIIKPLMFFIIKKGFCCARKILPVSP